MKFLSFFFICISTIILGQNNCQYSVNINNDNLKNEGFFTLSIKNIGTESFKISKKINFCNMRLVALEFYNEKTDSFENRQLTNKDIDCFRIEKEIKLRPNRIYTYNINVKSDFSVILSDNFFKLFNEKKYRFKISFALESYSKCGDNNDLITNWIYKN